jgi:serine/threonine protein kinase
MLCKAQPSGLLVRELELELFRLQAIKTFSSSSSSSSSSREESRSSSVRVPRLIACVKRAENGHIIGLLREWIDPGVRGGCLKNVCYADSTPAKERREKWAAQIRETVDRLHEMGVVWGDGKPRNVVIDSNDDAWLIDLGGGWTPGWVDEELVEGDEQAVRKILEFLGVEVKAD